MITLNLPRIARMELSMGGRGDMKFTTGGSPGNFSADLGLQKSFLNNKLSVTLKFDDIFDTKKFVINTENVITNPITQETYTQLMDAETDFIGVTQYAPMMNSVVSGGLFFTLIFMMMIGLKIRKGWFAFK